jgi:hypothetical protein
MNIEELIGKSEAMAEEISTYLNKVPADDLTPRQQVSEAACYVAWQHWNAIRGLLSERLFASAAVLHRAQYEALVRSIWLIFCATDEQVAKLLARSGPETAKSSKEFPMAAAMLLALQDRAPREAYLPLASFKETSWHALNSFVHTGRHAIRPSSESYPDRAVEGLLRNSNGLGVFTCATVVIVTGHANLQTDIYDIGDRYPECMHMRRDA